MTRGIRQQFGPFAHALAASLLAMALPPLAVPAHASGGELVLIPDLQLIGILLAVFALLVFPVNALLFKPVFRVMDERQEKIGGTRGRADRIERDAAALMAEYQNSVRAARDQADLDRRSRLDAARSEQAELTAAARQEAEVELERARTELERSLGEVRATLQASAEELARIAAERVLGRALS